MTTTWTMKDVVKISGTKYYQLPDTVRNRFETRLESALNRSLNQDVARFDFAQFKTTLQAFGAIIAGGSVLRACYDEIAWDIDTTVKSDIDIYVNVRNVPDMKEALSSVATTFSSRKSNLYCNSFLVRNRIREVIEIVDKDIDIVSVRNARNVLDVVQNFDLTMCQVWYNGQNMYATHPQHILDMYGELQGDYIDLYKTGNRFLKNRIEKYCSRGFTINRGSRTNCKNVIQKTLGWLLPSAPTPVMYSRPASYPVLQEVTNIGIENGLDMSGYDSEEYDELPMIYSIYNKIPNSGQTFSEVIAHTLENVKHKSYVHNNTKRFDLLCNEIKTKQTPAYNKESIIDSLKKKIDNATNAYNYINSSVFIVSYREKHLADLQQDIAEKTSIINALQ